MSDACANSMIFERWREGIAQIALELPRLASLIDLVRLNEPAMVSILAAGAARVGYTPVMEANITKAVDAGNGAAKPWTGRSDLMLSSGESFYAFEFKLSWHNSTSEWYDQCLDLAMSDAVCLSKGDCEHRYAGITSTYSNAKARECARAYQKADNCFVLPFNETVDTGLIVMFRKVV